LVMRNGVQWIRWLAAYWEFDLELTQ